MAICLFALVPIAAYRVVVELAAGNVLGALVYVPLALFGALVGYVLWTEPDVLVDHYMSLGRPWPWRRGASLSATHGRLEPEPGIGTTREAIVEDVALPADWREIEVSLPAEEPGGMPSPAGELVRAPQRGTEEDVTQKGAPRS
jgi:hypothetical protein